jgi:hypothetical protein
LLPLVRAAAGELQRSRQEGRARHLRPDGPRDDRVPHALAARRGKNVFFVGILENLKDEFNVTSWELQIEGSKTGKELPGIVDQIVTMQFIDFGDGKAVRALVCTQPNAWKYPAKDRSGRLEQIEEPHLGKLARQDHRQGRPQDHGSHDPDAIHHSNRSSIKGNAMHATLEPETLIEMAEAETLSGDIRDALLTHVRSIQVPWTMLAEDEQQNAIDAIEKTAALPFARSRPDGPARLAAHHWLSQQVDRQGRHQA